MAESLAAAEAGICCGVLLYMLGVVLSVLGDMLLDQVLGCC